MRSMLGSLFVVAGCSESWVFAPTADATLEVGAGTAVVEGEAILRFDAAEMPPADEIVGDALRLEATSSRPETVVLAFPEADPRDLTTFQEANLLNVEGVYRSCSAVPCEVAVPFRITREGRRAAVVEVSGDAILTVGSLEHRTTPESDAASLELVLF